MFNSPDGGVPLRDIRKIFTERSQLAEVPNGVETVPKISIAWVGRKNVTDEDRQTDGRRHVANVIVSSHKTEKNQYFLVFSSLGASF